MLPDRRFVLVATLNNLLLPVVAIASLTVLAALGRLDPYVGGLVVGLAAIHVGTSAISTAVMARRLLGSPA